jgi:PIN domain nuclease of toxin-antitoxin system
VTDQPSTGARWYVERLAGEALAGAQPVCLDSTAVIGYVTTTERVAPLVARFIEDPDILVVISTITLAEVVTRPAMRRDTQRVEAIHAALQTFPALQIINFDQSHAVETAIVRAGTGLKLPDAAIVATARLAQAGALLGNDRQWRGKALGVPYHHIDDILALA